MWMLGARYGAGDLALNLDLMWRRGSPSEYLFNAGGQVTGVRGGDDHTVVNVSAEYKVAPRTTLSAFVKNLLDERYVLNNRSGSTVDAGAPRRIGVGLRYEL